MKIVESNGLKWVDIVKPKDEDIKFLEDNFPFHHLILEEIKTPTYHPVLESYGDYLFLILHFPNFYRKSKQIQSVEIDFLITKNALVTIRYQDFPDMENIFHDVEQNHNDYFNKTTGHLFHHLTKKLFSKMFPELDEIKKSIDDIEEHIFKDFNDNIIEKIAYIKKQILDFIRALKPQKAVWEAMHDTTLEFWGEEIKPYISDLIADYNRTLHFVETHREVMDSLHLTSSSLLDNRRNYVIKILTVFTAIILPLSLITSIYGMNLNYLPLADHPDMFWWFSGGMILIAVIAIIWLKKKGWV
ncbi:MAG: magnesium transporter CorA family protein [bacterium]|nr:magnesium transporter CorA family protein [bacterium]